MQEQFLLQLCPNNPPYSFISQSVHQQVHGPSVHGLVLAEENEKIRPVHILGEDAPTAELDISRIRQFNRLFLTLIHAGKSG